MVKRLTRLQKVNPGSNERHSQTIQRAGREGLGSSTQGWAPFRQHGGSSLHFILFEFFGIQRGSCLLGSIDKGAVEKKYNIAHIQKNHCEYSVIAVKASRTTKNSPFFLPTLPCQRLARVPLGFVPPGQLPEDSVEGHFARNRSLRGYWFLLK